MTIPPRLAYWFSGVAVGFIIGVSGRFFGISPTESLIAGGIAVGLGAVTIASARPDDPKEGSA